MLETLNAIPLHHNTLGHRFELNVDGEIAYIFYETRGDDYVLIHTIVPESLEGKGVGSTLIDKTLNYIEEKGKKIIPECSFVAAYLKRHPEWMRIVAEKE